MVGLFWSPLSNTRTDEWGGILENRMRFGMLVIDEVRQAVGDDFHVGVRMPGDELLDKGLTLEDCVKIGKGIAQTGKIDHISITGGSTMDLHERGNLDAGYVISGCTLLAYGQCI